MRFSIIAVAAAFSSTVLAQGLLDQIPKCAQTCFGTNLGTCGVADIACICSSKVIDTVSCCVFASCSQSDIAATTQFGVQLCKLQNINVNTAPSCPSGSATLSGSATPSSNASPSAGNSSGTPAAGSASMTASGSASTTPSGSASRSSAASASAAGSTGAAHHQTAGAGVGLGAAMFGLLAAL